MNSSKNVTSQVYTSKAEPRLSHSTNDSKSQTAIPYACWQNSNLC